MLGCISARRLRRSSHHRGAAEVYRVGISGKKILELGNPAISNNAVARPSGGNDARHSTSSVPSAMPTVLSLPTKCFSSEASAGGRRRVGVVVTKKRFHQLLDKEMTLEMILGELGFLYCESGSWRPKLEPIIEEYENA